MPMLRERLLRFIFILVAMITLRDFVLSQVSALTAGATRVIRLDRAIVPKILGAG